MLGEHSKSLWLVIYTFSHVLLIYHVGYHAGKPIESVVYCFIISHNIGSAGELA